MLVGLPNCVLGIPPNGLTQLGWMEIQSYKVNPNIPRTSVTAAITKGNEDNLRQATRNIKKRAKVY